jgi:hypothetical protein
MTGKRLQPVTGRRVVRPLRGTREGHVMILVLPDDQNAGIPRR